MDYSMFGSKLGCRAGIVDMMDNLSNALSTDTGKIMLGGGNPARIEAVEKIIEEAIIPDLTDKRRLFDLIGNYSSPKGDSTTAEVLAEYFRNYCGWNITKDNLLFCNGSQSALFMIFNLFAGRDERGEYRNILLPFTPEYIGYEDLLVEGYGFIGNLPFIEKTGDQYFRYNMAIDSINYSENISCAAISSPSNPTGKYFEKYELEAINQFCLSKKIPLIYDNAYGWPFPNVQFVNNTFTWNENMIVTLSLSKMGMPGLRTGVVIANEETIERLRCINAVSQLSPNVLGMYVLKRLVETNIMNTITKNIIAPFYESRHKWIVQMLKHQLKGYPVYLHESKGTMFVWLWLENFRIKSQELYELLKEKNVLTLSGHHFFIGNKNNNWKHKDECLRLTFTQPKERIEKGVNIVTDLIKKLYEEGSTAKLSAI